MERNSQLTHRPITRRASTSTVSTDGERLSRLVRIASEAALCPSPIEAEISMTRRGVLTSWRRRARSRAREAAYGEVRRSTISRESLLDRSGRNLGPDLGHRLGHPSRVPCALRTVPLEDRSSEQRGDLA